MKQEAVVSIGDHYSLRPLWSLGPGGLYRPARWSNHRRKRDDMHNDEFAERTLTILLRWDWVEALLQTWSKASLFLRRHWSRHGSLH
jgi:hypothetical protein